MAKRMDLPPKSPWKAKVAGLPNLPEDIFLIIILLLEPRQIVRCRQVCKSWQDAFSSPLGLKLALKRWYPLCHEVQKFDNLVGVTGISAVDVFDRIAGRYHNLHIGSPWTVDKYKMHVDQNTKQPPRYYPVAPWDYHTMDAPQDGQPFRFPQPLWTFGGDYVVYLEDAKGKPNLLLRDLAENNSAVVPFDLEGKILRRIRLRAELLAVEWAESQGCHHLNEEEVVHRHYATFFDINRSLEPSPFGNGFVPEIEIIFRNELKLHFFGLPLNKQDRFFSNHTQGHYTVFFWQPNRSMYTGDEEAPIESLAVWDISDPCEYRPSDDPSGHGKPAHGGPQHILGLGFRELDFYDARQRDVPSFTDVDVDDHEVHVIETGHPWINAPKPLRKHHQTTGPLWRVRAISIPLSGHGPHQITIHSRRMSVTEARDASARVRHTVDQVHEFPDELPVKLDLNALSLNTWIGNHHHVKLSKDLLKQVIGKGRIAGDQRWIIGENDVGELVVLRFDPKPSIWERAIQFDDESDEDK